MSLAASFQALFVSEVRKYNGLVAKQCNIDINTLNSILDDFVGDNSSIPNIPLSSVPSPVSRPNPLLIPSPAGTPRVSVKSAGKKTGKCPYIFKSGKNADSACGVACEEGGFCAKHNKSKEEPSEVETKKVVETKTEEVKKLEPKKAPAVKAKAEAPKPAVIAKAKEEVQAEDINVRKNKWGNYEDKLTGFVFDRTTEEAFGKQLSDGTVVDLTLNDIELCKANGWEYKMPLKFKEEGPKRTVTVKDIGNDDDLYELSDEDD